MSFSASWPGEVCATDAAADLVLEKANVSPPLDIMADDVRAVLEALAGAAGEALATGTIPSKSGLYSVSISGHVRQGETDTSTTSIYVSERVVVEQPPE